MDLSFTHILRLIYLNTNEFNKHHNNILGGVFKNI